MNTILLIIFIIYGIPLFRLRYRYRSTVYREKGWKINFRPWFLRETISLFTNRYFRDRQEIRMANRYRLYLAMYFVLLVLVIYA